MGQRDVSLDVIRILACLMVVAIHSPMPTADGGEAFAMVLNYLSAPCIGLFFMVSGSLLLPVKEEYGVFLRHRIGKVLWPTLFWTAVYLVVWIIETPDYLRFAKHVLSIPFSAQGHGVLWFMYTLVGVYLLAPILSAWLEKASKRDLQFVLILWGVTLCYPVIDRLVYLEESNMGILYYFGGYAGYFLLGYYLKRYPDSLSTYVAAGIYVVGAIALYLTERFDIEVDFYRTFWYLSIFVAAMCVAIWKTVVRIIPGHTIRYPGTVSRIAGLTFGVYLCHILIMRKVIWHIGLIAGIDNYILQTVIVIILTFVLSLALCEILSRLPYARYLIGYKAVK